MDVVWEYEYGDHQKLQAWHKRSYGERLGDEEEGSAAGRLGREGGGHRREGVKMGVGVRQRCASARAFVQSDVQVPAPVVDRKSTRLYSSHWLILYVFFFLTNNKIYT